MKHLTFPPQSGSFLTAISESFNEEFSPTKKFIRERKLIKRVTEAVREEYDYIRNIMKAPETLKFTAEKIIYDMEITLLSFSDQEQYELSTRNFSTREFIDFFHKKCKIGYCFY